MNASIDCKAPYNTAIFFDVENLTKGYGISQKIVKGLSLHDIVKSIGETEKTGRVAASKAYANWLTPKLSFLHQELVDLDIEPITVLGGSGGVLKNVADIRLAVDVVDMLHTHPEITTYVIVSGDGAYASLSRKLHEYSKVVIGCAYKQSTNKLFASACDHFIWIEDPEVVNDKIDVRVTDSRSQHLLEKLNNNKEPDSKNLAWVRINELLQAFCDSREYQRALKRGVNPSVIREFINAAIPNFEPSTLGFDRFIDFLAQAFENTEMAIYLIPPSEIKIGLKSSKPQNAVLLSKGNIKRFGQNDELDIRDRRIKRMRSEIKSISVNASTEELAEKLKEIIGWIASDEEFRTSITEGINPSTIECAIRDIIVGFGISRLGFPRFSDLLSWLTSGTELCIAQSQENRSTWKVVFRQAVPSRYTVYESKHTPTDLKSDEKANQLTPWECIAPTEESGGIFKQLANMFKPKH